MDEIRKMMTSKARVPLVEAFIEKTWLDSETPYHWHGVSGSQLGPEWLCDICGESSHYYTTGIKRKSDGQQAMSGFFRIEGSNESPRVCEGCDRIIHKMLGTADEL